MPIQQRYYPYVVMHILFRHVIVNMVNASPFLQFPISIFLFSIYFFYWNNYYHFEAVHCTNNLSFNQPWIWKPEKHHQSKPQAILWPTITLLCHSYLAFIFLELTPSSLLLNLTYQVGWQWHSMKRWRKSLARGWLVGRGAARSSDGSLSRAQLVGWPLSCAVG